MTEYMNKQAKNGLIAMIEGIAQAIANESERRRHGRAVRNIRTALTTRPMTITKERRAQLKTQGEYMGYLRHLNVRDKAKAKSIRKTKGVQAAIRFAKSI